ncbi:MAG: DUF4290 domain-containing protein [Microscillaceae bacterium]|jgi:hypothetical protein|nr:DUF4290 domain-containing protein [Microscillaceae bacterium]
MEHYYNSQQPHLILREYGRNIQKLAQHVCAIEDREERTRQAYSLIELMRELNPNLQDAQDPQNKLWDDLFIISNFKLDVDSPFPMPETNVLTKKPELVPYNNHHIPLKHYGWNLYLMVKKALDIEDHEERFVALASLARLMKNFYLSWNRDTVQDITILEDLEGLIGSELGEAFYQRIKEEGWLELDKKAKMPESGNSNKSSKNKSGNQIPSGNQKNNNNAKKPIQGNQNKNLNQNQKNNQNQNRNQNQSQNKQKAKPQNSPQFKKKK